MKKNKTYLVITPLFPTKESFVGSYVFDQVDEIRKQTDYHIRIIKIVSLHSREKDYTYGSFMVNVFKIFDFPFFILPGLFKKINNFRFIKFLKTKNIKNISVSHAHVSYPCSYLQNILSCKKIVQHHGLDVLQLLNGRINFLRKMQRNFLIKNTVSILNNADLNIGVSQKVLNQLHKYTEYKPNDEIVLYNGVNTSKFFNIEKNNSTYIIGCIANFWKIKDQITLIKSVQRLINKGKNIKLRFIGSGYTLKQCKDYVFTNNLTKNITFEKELPHKELNRFYNNLDLFVLPSYFEALGCVYLESWATNTPFIAVENQGISEIIPNNWKELMLVPKSCDEVLTDKINYFMEHKVLFTFDQKYDIKNTISEFLKHKIFND